MALEPDSAIGSAGMPSFRDRLRMTWELTWPLAALDLAVVTVIHGLLDAQGETLDSIWALAGFFVVSPWVIRRALARAYGNRQAAVIASDSKETRHLTDRRAQPGAGKLHAAAVSSNLSDDPAASWALTYQQSLKVMWLLAWRSTVMALAALLLISALLYWAGFAARDLPTQGPLVNALGLSLADALTSLIFFPFLIPGMLRKRYRDFHLEWRSRKSEGRSAGKQRPGQGAKGRKFV